MGDKFPGYKAPLGKKLAADDEDSEKYVIGTKQAEEVANRLVAVVHKASKAMAAQFAMEGFSMSSQQLLDSLSFYATVL